jgi:hypothetical protein
VDTGKETSGNRNCDEKKSFMGQHNIEAVFVKSRQEEIKMKIRGKGSRQKKREEILK